MAFWELMTMRPLDWLERKGFSMRITPGTCVMASCHLLRLRSEGYPVAAQQDHVLAVAAHQALMSMAPLGETDTSISGTLPKRAVYSSTAASLERSQLSTE
mgnify:CR=1 FL=1